MRVIDPPLASVTRPRADSRVFAARTDPNPIFHIDWLLLGAGAAISSLGLLMIYSATRTRMQLEGLSRVYYVERQGIALAIGLVLGFVATVVDYRKLKELWPLLYGATLPLLLAVRVVGHDRGGTTAWFDVGPLQFQPSELAKLTLIVALAGYCQQHKGELDAWRLAVALTLAAIPMGLVMLQNDLGTMLVMAVCVVAILVVAGLKPVHIAVLALVGATLLGALVVSGTFSSYRADRLTSFIHQESNVNLSKASEAQYSLAQSKAAIAHGGLSGQGLFNGTLTKTNAVPEQHTDFIFTAVGEELGFRGGALLLALYALLVWRTWRTALTSGDFFGTLIATGLVAMFAFQVFENVGMTMGIMPITGIPLPFMSYGGSAEIAYWIGLGLVTNIHMRRFA
jgi:rod shape determining protein RodA